MCSNCFSHFAVELPKKFNFLPWPMQSIKVSRMAQGIRNLTSSCCRRVVGRTSLLTGRHHSARWSLRIPSFNWIPLHEIFVEWHVDASQHLGQLHSTWGPTWIRCDVRLRDDLVLHQFEVGLQTANAYSLKKMSMVHAIQSCNF